MAMNSYFDEVAGSLTNEDSYLLGWLIDKGATAKFMAVPYRIVIEEGGISEAILRKAVARLTALKFMEVRTEAKEHAVFITPYGDAAMQKLLSMVGGY